MPDNSRMSPPALSAFITLASFSSRAREFMQETLGILAAMLSSSIGGTAIGATRYLAGHSDPLTIGAFRFGIGFVVLFPIALLKSQAVARQAGLAGRGRTRVDIARPLGIDHCSPGDD
jgi:hypothetical protein